MKIISIFSLIGSFLIRISKDLCAQEQLVLKATHLASVGEATHSHNKRFGTQKTDLMPDCILQVEISWRGHQKLLQQ